MNGRLQGDPKIEILGVGTLKDAVTGDISFLANKQYKKILPLTQASAVILSEEDATDCRVPAIIVNNPYLAYAKIATLLYTVTPIKAGIAPSAVVADNAQLDATAILSPHCVVESGASIGAGVFIGAGVYVGENVVIGKGCIIHANVSLYTGTVIGEHTIIHSGAVLGSDGFGIVKDTDGKWLKVPQIGRVLVGNHVEIGSNTTIDRGAIGDTVIEDNVRLDNQIQVAHNVQIGTGTAIAGCVGISGSTTIGKRCLIGGGVGFVGHIEVTDDVVITGMTLVTKSIKTAGVYSSGVPAKPDSVWKKTLARLNQLDRIISKFNNNR